jgi:putative oxidoreductase
MPSAASRPHPGFALLLLRLGLGVIMLFHGVFKVTHGVGWMHGPLGAHGLPFVLAYGTYVAEVAAPLLLIAGAATRVSALIIAFDMVGAIVLVVSGRVMTASPTSGAWGIEVEAAIFVMAVVIALAGPGRYRLVQMPPPWD